MVELLFCYTINFIDFISHHPTKKINSMNTLIHKGSTILSPCSSPWSLCVIILISVPTYMNRTMGKFSKSSCFKSFSHLLDCNIKSILMTRRYFYAFFLRQFNNLICIFNAHCHRFLDNTVDSMLNTVQSNLCMKTAFCCNTNKFDFIFFNHFFVVCISFNTCIIFKSMFCKNIFDMFRYNIAGSYKFELIIYNSFYMIC